MIMSGERLFCKKYLSTLLFTMGAGVVLALTTLALAVTPSSAQSLLVPAYKYPTTWTQDPYWDTIIAAGGLTVPYVIVNPNNGPGSVVNPDYTVQVRSNTAAGIKNIGYAYLSYQSRPLTDVKQDIDRWHALYPETAGFFLDEVDASNPASLCYMSQVFNYIKTKWPSDIVVANPGVHINDEFAPYADIFVTFEGDSEAYLGSYQSPTSHFELQQTNTHRLMHIIHGVAPSDYSVVVETSRERGAGWLYVTDDTMPNPYDTLPTNFTQLANELSATPSVPLATRPAQPPMSGCVDPYAATLVGPTVPPAQSLGSAPRSPLSAAALGTAAITPESVAALRAPNTGEESRVGSYKYLLRLVTAGSLVGLIAGGLMWRYGGLTKRYRR